MKESVCGGNGAQVGIRTMLRSQGQINAGGRRVTDSRDT